MFNKKAALVRRLIFQKQHHNMSINGPDSQSTLLHFTPNLLAGTGPATHVGHPTVAVARPLMTKVGSASGELSFKVGPGDLVQFVLKQQKNPPLDRIRKDKIVDLSRMRLSVTMNALDALLHIHGIPWQIEIEQNPVELIGCAAPSSPLYEALNRSASYDRLL